MQEDSSESEHEESYNELEDAPEAQESQPKVIHDYIEVRLDKT